MKAKAVLKRLSRSLFSHWLVLGVFFVIGVGVFTLTQGDAHAVGILETGFTWGVAKPTAVVIGVIGTVISSMVGIMLILVIKALVFFAKYNDFISSPAVTLGWIVMRDMANMFFVFILLAIAIGTILQQEKYSYRTLLPGFIMAAILVNFSKTIAGFIIDISQVVMNTFVAAFATAGGGNFSVLLGIPKYMSLVAGGDIGTVANSAGALILATIFSIISLIVVGMMTMMLVMRIVGLWFLVILSPWAFMLNLIPRGQSYAKKWWDSFTNLVLLGPVMAFFLWVSLAVVAQLNPGVTDVKNTSTAGLAGNIEESPDSATLQVAGTEIGTFQGIVGYLLGIGMLIGTIAAASELGAGGGKFAGQITGSITKMANGAVGRFSGAGLAGAGFKGGTKFAGEVLTGKKGPLKPARDNIASRLAVGQEKMASKIAGTGAAGKFLMGGRAAELDRQNIISAEKEKQLKTKIDREMTSDFKKLSADDYDTILKNNKEPRSRRIAAMQQLADKGKLTGSADHLSLVDDLSKDLKGTEMGKKFEETLRTKNWDAAFANQYVKENAAGIEEVNIDKLLEHLYDGKINLSQLTQDQREKIKDKDPNFINTMIEKSGGDAQKLGKGLGSMSSESVEYFKKNGLNDAMLQGLGGDQLREIHKKGLINAGTRNKHTYTTATGTLDEEKIIADAIKDPNLLSSMQTEMTDKLILQNPAIVERIVSQVDDPGQIKKIFGNLSDETKTKLAAGTTVTNTAGLARAHKEAMVDAGVAGHHLLKFTNTTTGNVDYSGIMKDAKNKDKVRNQIYTDGNGALGSTEFVTELMSDKGTLPKENDIKNMDPDEKQSLQGTLQGLLATSSDPVVRENAQKTLGKVSQNLMYNDVSGAPQTVFGNDADLTKYLSSAHAADLKEVKNLPAAQYNTVFDTIARKWDINEIKKLGDENRTLAEAVVSHMEPIRNGGYKEGNFSDKSWEKIMHLLP